MLSSRSRVSGTGAEGVELNEGVPLMLTKKGERANEQNEVDGSRLKAEGRVRLTRGGRAGFGERIHGYLATGFAKRALGRDRHLLANRGADMAWPMKIGRAHV